MTELVTESKQLTAQKKTQRVFHFCANSLGGVGCYVSRLNDALNNAGWESTVLSPDTNTTPAFTEQAGEFQHFTKKAIRSLTGRFANTPFQSAIQPVRMHSTMEIMPADIVHLHGMLDWIGVKNLESIIPRESKVFWTLHDMWPLSGGCIVYRGCDKFQSGCKRCPALPLPLHPLASHQWKALRNWIASRDVQLIANSSWTAQKIQEANLAKDHPPIVVPPILHSAFADSRNKDLREELNIDPNRNVIGLGARSLTDEFKGIPEFLNAAASDPSLPTTTTYLLFGEGDLSLPSNLDVRMLGPVSDPYRLAKIYRTMNLFVSPSQMETFGMALAEAQAVETPVACFDVGGVRDAISLQLAEVVPTGDFPKFLAAVKSLLEKPKGEMATMLTESLSPTHIADIQSQAYLAHCS